MNISYNNGAVYDYFNKISQYSFSKLLPNNDKIILLFLCEKK